MKQANLSVPLVFPTFLQYSVWNLVASDGTVVDFNKPTTALPPFLSFQ